MRQFKVSFAVGAAMSVLLSGSAVLAADLAPVGADPATQPTTRPDGDEGSAEGRDPRRLRERHGGFMQWRSPDNYRNEELPADEEWEEIVEFMKANSPVRMEMYEKIATTMTGTGSDRLVNGSKRRIAGRYRDLMAMKDRSPEMYEFAVKQVQLEDQILTVLREIRASGDNEAQQKKFRELVTAYVGSFLNEREARLKRLRDMVERETKQIENDRANMGDAIDKQSERFEKELSRLIDFWEDPERFKPQAPTTP